MRSHVEQAYGASRLLTVNEVAELLQVHHKTVRRRIHDGSIPAIRLGTDAKSPLRVPADALERWLHE